MIGGGIFIIPAIVASLALAPWAMLSAWVIGGLLALAGAMAYAELAALRPQAGGEYVYLREAFGPLWAFLTGWTSFVAGFSGAIAASAVGLAGYLGRFAPAAGDTTALASFDFGLVTLTLSPRAGVAIVAIGALSVVHVLGLGPGRVVQNLLAGLKVTALLLFVAFGFGFGRGSMGHVAEGGDVAATSWLLALIPVMFSYAGWNAAAYVAEEVREPERNVPLALALGTVAVIVIYLGLNVVYLYAFSARELAGLKIRIIDAAADRLIGPAIADWLAGATIVMIAASISAMLIAGPRVYYAMARDGLFFSAAARVHPRFRTPAVAIVAQALWSAVLVLSGRFDQLVEYTGFAVVLFSGIAVVALFRLRQVYPNERRPFRAWGYPIAPGVFAGASFLIVMNALYRDVRTSGAGLIIIAAGIPLYLMFRKGPGVIGRRAGRVTRLDLKPPRDGQESQER